MKTSEKHSTPSDPPKMMALSPTRFIVSVCTRAVSEFLN